MTTTTDFEGWLDDADPEGHEEVYALYRCVIDESELGMWKCARKGEQLFLSAGHVSDTLRLASEKAQAAFLESLRARYTDGDMEVEGWYAYRRAMAKEG